LIVNDVVTMLSYFSLKPIRKFLQIDILNEISDVTNKRSSKKLFPS